MIGEEEGTILGDPATIPIPVPVRNKLLILRAKAFNNKGLGLGQPLAGKEV